MAIEKTVIVICDECGDAFTPTESTMSQKKARKEAEEEDGWECNEKLGTDHCLACKEGLRENAFEDKCGCSECAPKKV